MDSMTGRFTYFVILAGMRTGSNLLEETLNQVEGLVSHAEVFNPVHIGIPKNETLLGMTKAERDTAPLALLDRLKAAPGLNGFRFFDDHDPRVLPVVLADPACAKIVLTRNPVESYVSLLIARDTGEWRTGAVIDETSSKPRFDQTKFEAFLARKSTFQREVLHTLQVSGQTAFHLDYEDVQSVEVINGLLAYLGLPGRIKRISGRLVPQNPGPLSAKVENFADLEEAVRQVDWAALARLPNFEARRGPGVARALAAADAPVVFLPVPPDEGAQVRAWLSGLGRGGLTDGFSQKSLRAWLSDRPGRRSFTLVSHPMLRAHAVFRRVLADEDLEGLRIGLVEAGVLPHMELDAEGDLPAETERAGFLGFLRFVRANLNGQTPIQQNLLWASQMSILQGMAQFALPDLIAREETLAGDLGYLARMLGVPAPDTDLAERTGNRRTALARISDATVEAACQAAYSRDYHFLGYGPALPPL